MRSLLSSELCVLTALTSDSSSAKAEALTSALSKLGASARLRSLRPGAASRRPGSAALPLERERGFGEALHFGLGAIQPEDDDAPADEPAEDHDPARLPTVCFDIFVTKTTGGTPAIKRDGTARMASDLTRNGYEEIDFGIAPRNSPETGDRPQDLKAKRPQKVSR